MSVARIGGCFVHSMKLNKLLKRSTKVVENNTKNYNRSEKEEEEEE